MRKGGVRQEDQTLLAALEMVSEEALGSRNWQVAAPAVSCPLCKLLKAWHAKAVGSLWLFACPPNLYRWFCSFAHFGQLSASGGEWQHLVMEQSSSLPISMLQVPLCPHGAAYPSARCNCHCVCMEDCGKLRRSVRGSITC